MLKGFLLGVVTGGVAVWIWKDDIEAFLDARSRAARSRAADGVHAVGDTAGGVFDRAAAPLRRAEEMLDHGKEHVTRNLRAVEDTIRP